MNELLLNIISVVVTSILIPVIIFLGNKLSAYLKTKTENEKIQKYVDQAVNAVVLAVTSTAQTYVDALKKAGEFNEDAQKLAFNKAKDQALKLITVEGQKAIEALYGDFDEWLTAFIEATVKEIK